MSPYIHNRLAKHIEFCEYFYRLMEELTPKNLDLHMSIFNNSVTVHYYNQPENTQHLPIFWFQYCGVKNFVGEQSSYIEDVTEDRMVFEIKELLKKYDA